MKRPPTLDQAEERGQLADAKHGIYTFSNGTEWDFWAEPNCYACRWWDPDCAGAKCAFEGAALLSMVTPELAHLFGWIQDPQWDKPDDHRSGWDSPERCAFWHDKDDDTPEPEPIDPTQLTFLAPDGWPVERLPIEVPQHA